MKRISFLLILLSLSAAPLVRGQDARTDERLNKLSGQIEDLIAGQEAQKKRVSELLREMENLREQIGKPNNSYASQEDLKRLARSVEEVDRKRLDDYKKIETAIANLGTKLAPVSQSNGKDKERHSTTQKNSGADKGDKTSGDSKTSAESPGNEKAPANDKGFKYTIKSGDTISAIIQAYKDQNIKVGEKDILKANPGLVPEKMKVGQEIFIPAPPTGKKETASKD